MNKGANEQIQQYAMLNNLDPKEKQKNELVFKLLKSMNPYMPQLPESSSVRNQLYSILQSQSNKIIMEEGREHEESDDGEGDGEKTQYNSNMARRIVSRVVNVHVDKGRWGESTRKDMENAVMRELEAQKYSRIVRKQIESIQSNVFKQFRIQPQIKSTYKQPSIFRQYQSQMVPKSHTTSSPFLNLIPTARSLFFDPCSNSSPSKYQSPMKSYRHETDRAKSAYNTPHSARTIHYDNLELEIESRIGQKNDSIHKSKSVVTIRTTKNKVPAEHIRNQYQASPGRKFLLAKASDGLIKQAQKLDYQIVSSILDKKLRKMDKPSTISQLIK